jgi:hypothetical protein
MLKCQGDGKSMVGLEKEILITVLGQIEELSSQQYLFEEGEVPPSPETISRAMMLVEQAIPQIEALQGVEVDVHPDQGSVRIVWSQGAKTIKLVIPANRDPYIYRQDGEEHSVMPYDLTRFAELLNELNNDSYESEK